MLFNHRFVLPLLIFEENIEMCHKSIHPLNRVSQLRDEQMPNNGMENAAIEV